MARGPDRTLDVLLLFRQAPPEGLGITEIAGALGIYKSMTHRILTALEDRGLVRQEARLGRYQLGHAALALAGRFLGTSVLAQAALPALERLAAAAGAPGALYVGDGPEQVCLAATGTALPALGERRALLPGAPGLVLLAHTDTVERAGLLGALDSRAAIEPAALAAELEQVRRQGWATAAGATAAPVFRGRQLIAAVAARSDDAARVSPPVVAAAQAIGGSL